MSTSVASLQEISTHLATCSAHLQAASDSFSQLLLSLSRCIDKSSAQMNNNSSFPATVLWNELARAGIEVKISDLASVGRTLSSQADVLEQTSQLCSQMKETVQQMESSSAAEQKVVALEITAATVCSAYGSLFSVQDIMASSSSSPSGPVSAKRNLASLRQARPHVSDFCARAFGEFHRKLLQQDPIPSAAASTGSSSLPAAPAAVSAATGGANRFRRPPTAPPTEATVRQASAASTVSSPPTVVAAAASVVVADAPGSASPAPGGKKKRVLKKKKGARAASSRGSSAGGDDLSEAPAAASPSPAAAEPAAPAAAESAAATSKAKRGKRGEREQPPPPQEEERGSIDEAMSNKSIVLEPMVLDLGEFVLSASSGGSSGTGERSIEYSLPTSARMQLTGKFAPFDVLLSSRHVLTGERTSFALPAAASSSSTYDADGPFLRLIQQCVTDASLDIEVGVDLDILGSLSSWDAASVPAWNGLVKARSGAVSIGYKVVQLNSGKQNAGVKWESLFALLRNDDGSRYLVRQDLFHRSRTHIVETCIKLSRDRAQQDRINFSVGVSAPSGDQLGLAFARVMRELISSTAAHIVSETAQTNNGARTDGKKGQPQQQQQQQQQDLLALDTGRRSKADRQALDSQQPVAEAKTETGGFLGAIVGVVTAPVALAGRVVGSVANAASDGVKSQQLGLFQREFGRDPAEVIELFNCARNREEDAVLLQGLLFLTQTRIHFCPTVMKDGKFSISWRDVKAVEKKVYKRFFNNSIELQLFLGDAIFLTSFINRDEAINKIFAAWTGK